MYGMLFINYQNNIKSSRIQKKIGVAELGYEIEKSMISNSYPL
jgi:hypothetical protein